MSMRRTLILVGLALGLASPTSAQQQAPDWVSQKCAAYAAAWTQALDMFGSGEMNDAFMAGNENFIASGCTESRDICPRSSQELEIANALTLALMNAGTASTFLPFRCPPTEPESGGWSGPGL
jgi:hypothetical protein